MEPRESDAADPVPFSLNPTAEETAAALALFDAEFDPVQAEKEYRALADNGGETWEQLMQKLDEIDQSQTRSS
jgi:hypothetical protein